MNPDTRRMLNLYAPAKSRAVAKQLPQLDPHCIRFISLSPFVVLASGSAEGRFDASPRGGEPGFVKVINDRCLLIPDAPGNNRLDTMTNIGQTGALGLLFLVPGIDETLRVNGQARLTDAGDRLAHFAGLRHAPRLVIELSVQEAYLHCAKALMRSQLWAPGQQVQRSVLPTLGQMINDQIGSTGPVESQEQLMARYAQDL